MTGRFLCAFIVVCSTNTVQAVAQTRGYYKANIGAEAGVHRAALFYLPRLIWVEIV